MSDGIERQSQTENGLLEGSDLVVLLLLALGTLVIHVLTGGRYGFHRDELATLDDARHLAWGYVAYPPVTPFFGWLSLNLFGTSLTGFRFFAALADAVSVVLAGLIAQQLGGGRRSQLLAAAAVIPFCLGAGTLMQYVSFDYLFWILTAYFVARRLRSADPRWWIGIGISIGLGMLTKYSMLVCAAGVVVAVLLTDLRRDLGSKWLWAGVVCALLIFVPNFVWQVRHDFVSLQFLAHIHARDVRIGRTQHFLSDQVMLNVFALPIAIVGLYFYFFSSRGRPFRALGWLYVTAFTMFLIARGRGYYLEPAYPVLFAGGSVWIEEQLAKMIHRGERAIWAIVWLAMAADISVTAAFWLPLAPVGSAWWRTALKINSDFAEEFGWPELVETVARIRDSLPENEKTRVAILAGNYGEAGAIDLYGPGYGLPKAISGTNSYWARGYGDPPPETVILLGFSNDFAEHYFEQHEVVAHSTNRYGVANEETTEHRDIYLCRRLKVPWPDFWRGFQRFG